MPPWLRVPQHPAPSRTRRRSRTLALAYYLRLTRSVTRGWRGSLKLLGLRITKAPTDNRMHASSKVRPIANPQNDLSGSGPFADATFIDRASRVFLAALHIICH